MLFEFKTEPAPSPFEAMLVHSTGFFHVLRYSLTLLYWLTSLPWTAAGAFDCPKQTSASAQSVDAEVGLPVQLLQTKTSLESRLARAGDHACSAGYGPGMHLVQLPSIERQFLFLVPPELVACSKNSRNLYCWSQQLKRALRRVLTQDVSVLCFGRVLRVLEVHSSSGVPLVMSFHGTFESPWFHEREVGYMDVLSRHGWLGILPWGTRLESPSAMGGVTECCSRWCDSEECCMKGGFVSAKIEACGWWVPERDVTLVDTIWNWVEEHTCVDRTKACRMKQHSQRKLWLS